MDSRVLYQVSWKLICLEKPHASVFEVVEKLFIRLRAHVPGPNHLGAINVRPIVNPFVVWLNDSGRSARSPDDAPYPALVLAEFSPCPGTMLVAAGSASTANETMTDTKKHW